MNDSKVAPVEAQAVPDQPVAWLRAESSMEAWSSWSLQPPGADNAVPVFTRPTPAAADLHQQSHSVHLAVNDAEQDFRAASALSEAATNAAARLDAARYRWLTAHAFVGECFTENGTVLEIHNTDRGVPIGGSVDAAIDAAMKGKK